MIFLSHAAILSSGRIKLFLGSSLPYQSMLAQWKSDGFITRKCLDRNEDMYKFLSPGCLGWPFTFQYSHLYSNISLRIDARLLKYIIRACSRSDLVSCCTLEGSVREILLL
jgi:hypothetical protein